MSEIAAMDTHSGFSWNYHKSRAMLSDFWILFILLEAEAAKAKFESSPQLLGIDPNWVYSLDPILLLQSCAPASLPNCSNMTMGVQSRQSTECKPRQRHCLD